MTRYLTDLANRLQGIGIDAPLSVMESAGGVMPVELACRRTVATIESGPAAGAIAARVVGTDLGHDDVIAFDMGGTTAKAAVIRGGRPDVTHQFQVGGRGSFGTRRSGTGVPIKTPTIDLAEVGAGGGSIAWVDDAGALHVGPRSAGSDPGPAWYGLGGTLPTVTDASVVLGLLDPAGFESAGTGPGVGRALRFDAAREPRHDRAVDRTPTGRRDRARRGRHPRDRQRDDGGRHPRGDRATRYRPTGVHIGRVGRRRPTARDAASRNASTSPR